MQILEDESLDDLQLDGLVLIQKKKGFRFGSDAVLLADFAAIRPSSRVLEFGTGSGIVSLLCAHHYKNVQIDALEIQPQYADMATRCVEMNGLKKAVKVHCCDLKEVGKILSKGSYDCVITNPPYKKANAGENAPESDRAIARSEICATLDDVVKAASIMLKNSGKLIMVHRPQRLNDIILTLSKYRMTAKCLRFVCAKTTDAPSVVLIEAMRNVKSDTLVMPPLIMYNENGSESNETARIYRRIKNDS